MISYVPGGRYIPKAGWTTISTFFNDNYMGACEYRLHSMIIATGAQVIPKEAVRYDINNKVTTVDVVGSEQSGFMYFVIWHDDSYNHYLTCANMKLDSEITNRMIELAKKIDKSI